MMSIKADKTIQEKPSMCPSGRTWRDKDNVGHAIDSGIGLSITIDKLRVFINKTLSILSAYQ